MKKVITLLLAVCLCFTACLFAACGEPTVESIEVTKMPTRTEYYIDDVFSAEGGEITATYSDGTTEVVPMTDERVTVSKVKTDPGSNPKEKERNVKNVTVSFGGARVRFEVGVSYEWFAVSFDLGYEGGTAIAPLEVKKGDKADAEQFPAAPSRGDDFEFDGWFTDADFTDKFDVSREITGDLTLYAKWLDVAATYYTLKLNGNYYGAQKVSDQKIEEGMSAKKPKDPQRNGYRFDGWFTAADGGAEYAFGEMTADAEIFAHWTKTSTGSHEYIFEGEDIDFTGKKSNGYSGTAEGKAMIVIDSTTTASNGRYIGWTYRENLTLEFYFASDVAADDATIVARLSAEFANMVLTPNMFRIELNDVPLDYGTIAIFDVPSGGSRPRDFQDFTLKANAPIKEGANKIVFTVANNVNWIGPGEGTIGGTAPLIDCVKITTEAVLYWDGTYGLPMKNYR